MSVFNKQISRLIAFDLDGTLAVGNIWETINIEVVGMTPEEDQKWLHAYEAGDITYAQWMGNLEEVYRKSGKKRLDFERVIEKQVQNNIPEEARQLIADLQKQGEALCIVSGGIDLYVEAVAKVLRITKWYANNQFEFDSEGNFKAIQVDGDEARAKKDYLERLGKELGISPSQIIPIGDSPNDVEAFIYTGNGIYLKNPGSKPRPQLEKASQGRIIASIGEARRYL